MKPAAKKKPATTRKATESKGGQLSAFLLLDRSASMVSMWEQAIRSINSYVKELASHSPDAEVTLATFDSLETLKFEILRGGIKAKNWKSVDTEEAHPRGNTPLYDAIGPFVGLAFGKSSERAVLVIMTDGYENSSTAITKDTAKALLDMCRAKGWQTIFLGADFDAMPQAVSLNNSISATINVRPQNLVASMSTLAGYTASYAARGMAMNFTQADRAQASRTTS